MKFRERKSTDFLYIHLRDTDGLTLKELHVAARRSGKLTVDYHYIVQENGDVEEGRSRYEIAGNQLENHENSIYILVDSGDQGILSDAQRLSLHELMDSLHDEFPNMKSIVNEGGV